MPSVVGLAVIEGMTEAAVGPVLSKLSQEVYRIHAFQGDVEALKRQFTILRKVPQNIWNKWKISKRISRLSKELRHMEELAVCHGLSWQQAEPPPPPIEEIDVKTASILFDESFIVVLDAKVPESHFLVEAHPRGCRNGWYWQDSFADLRYEVFTWTKKFVKICKRIVAS